jgi:hypothetical protein
VIEVLGLIADQTGWDDAGGFWGAMHDMNENFEYERPLAIGRASERKW